MEERDKKVLCESLNPAHNFLAELNSDKRGKPTDRLFNKLKNNWQSLKIDRIPRDTKIAFKKFAKEQFCDDFGMALKWLIDGLLSKDNEAIILKLSELEERIILLEQKENVEPVVEPKMGRRMLDGSHKKLRGKEK